MNRLSDHLGPISGGCTAVEAAHGTALGDQTVSARQIDVRRRAYNELAAEMLSDDLPQTQLTASEDASEARAAEQAGDPASRRTATILLGADEPVWVLRFWDTGHEDLTVWAGDNAEDAAITYLASYVRGNWSNLTDHSVVGEQPPASDRDAIRLFYAHPDKQAGQRGAEGYTLSAEPVRTAR